MHDFSSIELYGRAVRENGQEGSCDHFHLENENGAGDITIYPVFPGIDLIYNDMHMESCSPEQKTDGNVIEINHCHQGRCECTFGGQTCCYVAPGDLSFCSLQRRRHRSSFPTGHYHGITVLIDLSRITEELHALLQSLSVELSRIDQLCRKQDFYIIRASDRIGHVFSELYTVRDHVRAGYARIKVLELLLMLTDLDPEMEVQQRSYFPKAQIDRVKAIRDFMVEHVCEHYTIEELSERFRISQTAMKQCFKGVYGTSVYAYLRTYRLQVAEKLLCEKKLSVAEIAAQVGYENPNKFTCAFKAEYGISPREYRKNV